MGPRTQRKGTQLYHIGALQWVEALIFIVAVRSIIGSGGCHKVFAARLQISHFRLSLETKDAAEARRLVPALDAMAVEVFMGDAERITQVQLGNLFKAVLVQHKVKLADLADYERAKPLVPRPTLLKEEIAQGFAHVLLSKLGATATLSPDEEKRLPQASIVRLAPNALMVTSCRPSRNHQRLATCFGSR